MSKSPPERREVRRQTAFQERKRLKRRGKTRGMGAQKNSFHCGETTVSSVVFRALLLLLCNCRLAPPCAKRSTKGVSHQGRRRGHEGSEEERDEEGGPISSSCWGRIERKRKPREIKNERVKQRVEGVFRHRSRAPSAAMEEEREREEPPEREVLLLLSLLPLPRLPLRSTTTRSSCCCYSWWWSWWWKQSFGGGGGGAFPFKSARGERLRCSFYLSFQQDGLQLPRRAKENERRKRESGMRVSLFFHLFTSARGVGFHPSRFKRQRGCGQTFAHNTASLCTAAPTL